MKNNINELLCSRCQLNNAEYKCENCPILFNTLCPQCDTTVHSIIPEKLMHKKIRINSNKKKFHNLINVYKDNYSDKDIKNNFFNFKNENNITNNNINENENENSYIMKNNNFFANDLSKLCNENNILKEENEKLKNDIKNYENEYEDNLKELNNKLFDYENQVYKLKSDIQRKNNSIKDLNREIINNKTLEERKDIYEYQFKQFEREKQYLLNEIEKQKKIMKMKIIIIL